MLLNSAEARTKNALTVDVEDYFQVSAFEPYVARDQWKNYESRIAPNMYRILELLDGAGAKCTFFFLGWVAEQFPAVLRAVVSAGHEIASHGYCHVRVTQQGRPEFEQDVDRTKKLLEDLSGTAVIGYRAASFSIEASNRWAHDVLAETGHGYSSSIYPIRHDRYGMREMPRFPFARGESGLIELPVTPVEVGGFRFPCGGGGYFRLLPYPWTRWGIRRVNEQDRAPVMFYFHPWELDPAQPRLTGLDSLSRFRHYVNLSGVEGKLKRLLGDFRWTTVVDAYAGVLAN